MKSTHCKTYWLAFIAAFAIGCERNQYEIILTPNGKSIDRQLVCWREQANPDGQPAIVSFPKDELERIAAAYSVPDPRPTGNKYTFRGTFGSRMPDDTGGSGIYTHWDTPLGSVSVWNERFRGNDDLNSKVDRRRKAIDRIVDLLVGWFTVELKGQPEFAQLKRFLETDLRADLKNLSLYGWAYDIASHFSNDAWQEFAFRVGIYLTDRGYITPEKLPLLHRAIQDIDSEGPAKLLAFVQRFLASKMGVPEDNPIPDCLQFLSDSSCVVESVRGFLIETDEYRQLLESWEAEWKRIETLDVESPKPAPETVIGDLVETAFLNNFAIIGGGIDSLNLTLALANQPFLTNGN